MSEEESVFKSSAAYYDLSSKKWKTGTFTLNNRFIQFCYEEDQTLLIPLNTLSGIEKRQCSLIYSAIVLSSGSDKHWFASFPNRDSVYNLLELFWRDVLLTKDHKTSPARPKPGTSDLGKDLLNILHESEITLVNAANSLSDQGKQIEESQATVEDINTDLSVAERVLRSLNYSQLLLQLTNSLFSSPDENIPGKCFKVTYTLSKESNESCRWNKGTLLIGDRIVLIDESKIKQLNVKHEEMVSIQVISSWKLCLFYAINDVEKSCHIMCPKLLKLLKYLNTVTSLKEKIVYADENHSQSTSSASDSSPSSSGSIRSLLSPTKQLENISFTSNSKESQEYSDLITDEDIEEISTMLANLQNLAAEVSKEQQEQMEKINDLVSDVEKTDIRIKADTKKMKKM